MLLLQPFKRCQTIQLVSVLSPCWVLLCRLRFSLACFDLPIWLRSHDVPTVPFCLSASVLGGWFSRCMHTIYPSTHVAWAFVA